MIASSTLLHIPAQLLRPNVQENRDIAILKILIRSVSKIDNHNIALLEELN